MSFSRQRARNENRCAPNPFARRCVDKVPFETGDSLECGDLSPLWSAAIQRVILWIETLLKIEFFSKNRGPTRRQVGALKESNLF